MKRSNKLCSFPVQAFMFLMLLGTRNVMLAVLPFFPSYIDGMLAHLELSVRVAFQFILESFHADFSVVLGIILRSTL